MSRRATRDQFAFRGMERDRLWSRLPDRTDDPLDSLDGCIPCGGSGVDLTATPPRPCRDCLGTGWSA